MEKDILIRNIKVESRANPVFGGADAAFLEAMMDSQKLFFSVPVEWQECLDQDSYDAFLIAALPYALLTGRNIRVEGPLSEKLFYNTSNDLIPVLCIQRPEFKPVSVKCEGLRSTSYQGAKSVSCGFSGGIDSLCTIKLNQAASPNYKITHFCNINAGAFTDDGFRYKLKYLERLALALGLPLINIDSNVHKVINISSGKNDHGKIHSIRNISPILALQKFIRKFYYSSGYSYRHCGVFQTDYCAYADPIILPLLSTETTEILSGESRLTRVQKTKIVSEMPQSYQFLNVCNPTDYTPPAALDAPLNCGKCKKCLRTLITFEILGRLEKYSSVFDLKEYQAARNQYIVNALILEPDAFEKEIIEYAVEKQFAPVVTKLSRKHWLQLKSNLSRFIASQKIKFRL